MPFTLPTDTVGCDFAAAVPDSPAVPSASRTKTAQVAAADRAGRRSASRRE